MKNILDNLAVWIIRALAIVGATSLLLLFFTPIYKKILDFFEAPGRTFLDTLPYIYIGIIGIVVTVVAIIAASVMSRRNQRKQDTIKILIESRLSAENAKWDIDRVIHFPGGKKASADKFFEFRKNQGKASSKKEKDEQKSYRAILNLLDHHEFISGGILEGILDEAMLKRDVRGIICRFTFQMRDVICRIRKDPDYKHVYANLVNVYWLWVDDESSAEWDKKNGVDLGPEPSDPRAVKRKAEILGRHNPGSK